MCIIAIAKERKLSEEEFKNCFESNKDGVGIAWRENEKLCFKKGLMTLNESLSFYNEKDIPLPHILHFRIGTSGGMSKEMTHPFIVNETSPLTNEYAGDDELLFHNGVITDWKNKLITYLISSAKKVAGNISDTRMLALLCSALGKKYLDNEKSNRFVVFGKKTINAWGYWEIEDGVLFSNTGYKSTYAWKNESKS